MPQWVFLSSFFNDILVKDRVALAASGSSSSDRLSVAVCRLLAALVCLESSIPVTVMAVHGFRLAAE